MAWILIQLGTENEVTTYIERFKTLTRRNAHRLPNIKASWDTFAWEIAVHMRTSVTFGKITTDLLADPVQLADILSQPLPKKQKGEKGKGKGKQKSKYRPTWSQTQWYPPRQHWQQGRQPAQYNTNYSYGPSQRPAHYTQYSPFPPTPPPPTQTTQYQHQPTGKGQGKQQHKSNPNYKGCKGHKGQGKGKH